MNQNLQNILDAIQQNGKLGEDEKNSLLKALKDADKELEITAFKLERTEKVKKTTAILLEETIEELEQKRKAIEESNAALQKSLEELKTAQAQLVHSEKMASLGELTAGIAHEIKNPLNFVNNFSEISSELLDEMKTELENKNNEEVSELIENLKQNLEKINQHGKRADSIVKGMLLHSRGSTGEKVLTNINELADQYISLAYHGMKVQDREFNITMEKHYDETLGKVNIVPQDISRVILNVINNAFYACNDKKRKLSGNNSESDYNPKVTITTKKDNNDLLLIVEDNGSGIPDSVKEKLFQPFFTTKPTGEGTGLGLSLSYDIITKGHGGKLKIESKEGEGTVLTISLPFGQSNEDN